MSEVYKKTPKKWLKADSQTCAQLASLRPGTGSRAAEQGVILYPELSYVH